MPEITLRFKNHDEAEVYLQAPELSSFVWDFQNWLRGELKYQELAEDKRKVLEEVQEKWFEFKNNRQPELGLI